MAAESFEFGWRFRSVDRQAQRTAVIRLGRAAWLFGARMLLVLLIAFVAPCGSRHSQAEEPQTASDVWPEGSIVTGRILDHDGNPVANAEVMLLGEERIVVDAKRRTWFAFEKKELAPISSRTDSDGNFTVTRKTGDADRLAVISEDPLWWEVSRKSLSEKSGFDIKLPASGTLKIHCDIPSKPAALPVAIESKSLPGLEWTTDVLRFHNAETKMDNPGDTVFKHLPPGQFAVQRYEETPTGDRTVLMTNCDRHIIRIESTQQTSVQFERKTGRTVSGQVKGLEDSELRYARVTISHWSPLEVFKKDGKPQMMMVHFDVIPIKSDGKFTTDKMPPGEYFAEIFAVLESSPQLSSQSSDFCGRVTFEVPDEGDVPAIEVIATPSAPRDLSKVNDLRLKVVDEDGNQIPRCEAIVYTERSGYRPWKRGSNGIVFLGAPYEYQGAQLIKILVSADGYAPHIANFTGDQIDLLSKGEEKISLRPGQKVQLRFDLPSEMTWPKGTVPEAYFDYMRQRVRMMHQPDSWQSRGSFLLDALRLHEIAAGQFEFWLGEDSQPFYLSIHAPGFLQYFEAGPFSWADVKDGQIQVDVPRPATLDVSFEPGDHPGVEKLFKRASLKVFRRTEGNSILEVSSFDSDSLTPKLALNDLAPGRYLVQLQTIPQDNQAVIPGTKINAGIYRDRRDTTLKSGGSELIEFRSTPFDPNAFRGSRTAILKILTPTGEPAKNRDVTVTYFDGHYGSLDVYSGRVPESGRIVISDITDNESIPSNPHNSYSLSVNNERLGAFGFTTDSQSEEFEFTLAPVAGDIAPDIELTSLENGEQIRLHSLRGKVVFLEFWATWCGPCQEPMQKLNAIAGAHQDPWKDQVAIVAVSIDSERTPVERQIPLRGLTNLTHAWASIAEKGDFEAPAAKAFVVKSIPHAVLIDANGKILWRGHPIAETGGTDIKSRIEEALLLAEPTPR